MREGEMREGEAREGEMIEGEMTPLNSETHQFFFYHYITIMLQKFIF